MTDTDRSSKAGLVSLIGQYEGDVSRYEAQLRTYEQDVRSSASQRTIGTAAFVLGIIGIIFLTFLWWLWVLCFFAGALSAITAGVKGRKAKTNMAYTQEALTKARSKLAELRAQLFV